MERSNYFLHIKFSTEISHCCYFFLTGTENFPFLRRHFWRGEKEHWSGALKNVKMFCNFGAVIYDFFFRGIVIRLERECAKAFYITATADDVGGECCKFCSTKNSARLAQSVVKVSRGLLLWRKKWSARIFPFFSRKSLNRHFMHTKCAVCSAA